MLGPTPCGPLAGAPLLPQLRGCFAEFLGNASPAGLGVLPLSTCVGLRYGHVCHDSGFSWHGLRMLRYLWFAPRRALGSRGGIFLPAPCCACTGSLILRLMPPPCVPAVLAMHGTGISTCCPSATPPGLALGPDSPRADRLYPGNLGYPAWGIPTPISLLIPAFSLPGPPPPLPVRLP